MNILVLHGPNLNLLGEREVDIYGEATLDDVNRMLENRADDLGVGLRHLQSNHEGALIDQLHGLRTWMDGLVINPGGLAHTSVALHDAIVAVKHPAVEVHISDPLAREEFRHVMLTARACVRCIAGRGIRGYVEALEFLHAHLSAGS